MNRIAGSAAVSTTGNRARTVPSVSRLKREDSLKERSFRGEPCRVVLLFVAIRFIAPVLRLSLEFPFLLGALRQRFLVFIARLVAARSVLARQQPRLLFRALHAVLFGLGRLLRALAVRFARLLPALILLLLKLSAVQMRVRETEEKRFRIA